MRDSTVGGGSDDGVIDSWKDGGTVEGSAELQSLSLAASAPINSTAALFTLSGGSITGNAAETAGGVNVRGGMTVGGGSAITVTGNTASSTDSNVYFPEPHTDITVNSIPTDGTSIGVRMAAPGQFAAMGTDVDEVQAKLFFTSDDVDYNVLAMQDGLKLGKQHSAPNIQIDYQDETLTGFDASASYTINGEAVIPEADGTIAIKRDWFGTSISIVQKGDGDVADSEVQSLNIPARPVAPDVTGGTLKINGADTTMEYSTDHGATWTAFTDETVSSISAGTYWVRYPAAAGTKFASESVEVTVTRRSSGGVTTYPVTVTDTEHGTVTASHKRASRNTLITITVTPETGYELESLTVLDSRGEEITLTDKGDGKYTFTMPASRVTVEASFAPAPLPFDDVASGTWYEEAVRYVYFRGVMEGMSATKFSPNISLTRAQAVQVLYNLEGQPAVSGNAAFPDQVEEWYKPAIAWAEQTGVVDGYEDGTFRPGQPVNRMEFAQMLYNYAKYKGYDLTAQGDLTAFPDGDSVQPWAETAMTWANGNQLINGHDDGTLEPGGTTTRAQASSILMRFDQNVVEN